MFRSEVIIDNCQLGEVKERWIYENGKPSEKKRLTVSILVLGDKPIEADVTREQSVTLKLGIWGACRLHVVSEMTAIPYSRDGRSGVSYVKTDRDLVFKEFAIKPLDK